MKFSICIPSVRPDSLAAAVASIRHQSWPDWELVVLGQGDEAILRQVVANAAQGDGRVRYIQLQRRGLSIARNVGIHATTGEIVAMMDDDCEADVNWLLSLREYFIRDPDIGLVSGPLVAPTPTRRGFAVCPRIDSPEVVYDPVASARTPPRGWGWMGANFAVRRSVIARVGLFDEHLGAGAVFPAAEDTDYLLRIEALGIKMASTPRAIVYHTYGYRYGLRAMYIHARNYAYGDGGLAAKLTLLGDPRGKEWLSGSFREGTLGLMATLQFHRVPIRLVRLWCFYQAYRRCLSKYCVDERGMLISSGGAPLQQFHL